ncbi:hypothetical protein DFJ63DRAFT_221631 [Scheffersomyces coipomensis]|uniref:uncharacterized protein n=1 Tax=Scheffersomyces coipomensis TaxID=1788519 RepID=UPI00315C83D8
MIYNEESPNNVVGNNKFDVYQLLRVNIMSEVEFTVGDLKHVAKYLEDLSKNKKIKFMLITQTNHKNSDLKISYSSQFSEAQKDRVYSVLSEPHTNIATIKPALTITKDLIISRKLTKDLFSHYNNLFHCVSQSVCKEVAKQWIKIAEPNKQANFPYKNFNRSKPDWWPHNVDHIEPDHLDKNGRVEVLISILRNPHFSLQEMQRRTASIKFKREYTQSVLDEVYYVAVYDRLFYNRFRNLDPLFREIEESNKVALGKDYIILPVSKLEDSISRGLIMVSRLKPGDMNNRIFKLKGGTNHHEKSSNEGTPDVTPDMTPLSSPVVVKPSSRRKRLRRSTRDIVSQGSSSSPTIKVKKENMSSVTGQIHSDSEAVEYEEFFENLKEESPEVSKIEDTPNSQDTTFQYQGSDIIPSYTSDLFYHIDRYSSSSSETSYI